MCTIQSQNDNTKGQGFSSDKRDRCHLVLGVIIQKLCQRSKDQPKYLQVTWVLLMLDNRGCCLFLLPASFSPSLLSLRRARITEAAAPPGWSPPSADAPPDTTRCRRRAAARWNAVLPQERFAESWRSKGLRTCDDWATLPQWAAAVF